MKHFAGQLCPPLLWRGLSTLKRRLFHPAQPESQTLESMKLDDPDKQDLGVYWDPEMAKILETWGEGTTWHELKYLASAMSGRFLDIACGTGKSIEDLRMLGIEVYGCDVSDLLIRKAIERGIPAEYVKVCNATHTGYETDFFDNSYSIGSLEHFTEQDLHDALVEFHRITKVCSFHMVPVSKTGRDEGWLKTKQSYYCNSDGWWLAKFRLQFEIVRSLDSLWQGQFTRGKWYICRK
jgi:SAM-dependent methyltransferase